MRRYYLIVVLDGLDLTGPQPDPVDSALLMLDLQVSEAPGVSVRFRDNTARHADRAVEFMGRRGGCQVTAEGGISAAVSACSWSRACLASSVLP